MARETYRKCKQCGGFHATSAWPAECFDQFRKAKSDLPMPYIRSDGMDPIMNHADGRLYDSKSAYYGAVKAAGCEIVGDAKLEPRNEPTLPPGIGKDIKQAIEQLKATA